jgi:hypothetical protein
MEKRDSVRERVREKGREKGRDGWMERNNKKAGERWRLRKER